MPFEDNCQRTLPLLLPTLMTSPRRSRVHGVSQFYSNRRAAYEKLSVSLTARELQLGDKFVCTHPISNGEKQ